LKDVVDLGIPTSADAREIWKNIRNQLAHMAFPRGAVGAYQQNIDSVAMEQLVMAGRPAFYIRDGQWACVADRLYLDMPGIAKWLCAQIDCAEVTAVANALEWVRAE
jgi:hypothetical protein